MALSHECEMALDELNALLDEECDEVKARNMALRAQKDDAFLEDSGVLLRGAIVHDERPTLYTRTKVVFVPDKNRPFHVGAFDARPGSIVHPRMRSDQKTPTLGPAAVVIEKRPNRLVCVFDEAPLFEKGRVDLLRIDDEKSLRKLQEGVSKCKSLSGNSAKLLEALLGLRKPKAFELGTYAPFDERLNEAQQEAAQKAIYCEELALIHGPPGTGKTRVLVEVVRQLVDRGERVLCLCASNAATDHLALSLLERDAALPLARTGHPARANQKLADHTLAGLTDAHELRKISKKLVKDAHELLRNARKRSARGRDAYKAEREARVDAGRLFADARRLERQAVDEVMRKTRVLCGTLTGFERELRDAKFDVLVTDEASQVLTPALLLGAQKVSRVVLAGDHKQLPPTIISESAARKGLSDTTFEKAIAHQNAEGFSTMLTVQHRMHEHLMAFSSKAFYDDKLVAHESVKSHSILDFGNFENDIAPGARVLDVIDTAGAGFEEQAVAHSESRSNPQEAVVVGHVVRALLDEGLEPAQVGVITPYAGQVAQLSGVLSEAVLQGLEIDSVDGFQGREKDVIVVSLVRSNPLMEIGFVGDVRRLNVAVTRAKRKLVVVGDSATLAAAEIFRQYFDQAMASESYRSVFELGLDVF